MPDFYEGKQIEDCLHVKMGGSWCCPEGQVSSEGAGDCFDAKSLSRVPRPGRVA